jgi:hypothetical protein
MSSKLHVSKTSHQRFCNGCHTHIEGLALFHRTGRCRLRSLKGRAKLLHLPLSAILCRVSWTSWTRRRSHGRHSTPPVRLYGNAPPGEPPRNRIRLCLHRCKLHLSHRATEKSCGIHKPALSKQPDQMGLDVSNQFQGGGTATWRAHEFVLKHKRPRPADL